MQDSYHPRYERPQDTCQVISKSPNPSVLLGSYGGTTYTPPHSYIINAHIYIYIHTHIHTYTCHILCMSIHIHYTYIYIYTYITYANTHSLYIYIYIYVHIQSVYFKHLKTCEPFNRLQDLRNHGVAPPMNPNHKDQQVTTSDRSYRREECAQSIRGGLAGRRAHGIGTFALGGLQGLGFRVQGLGV